MLKSILSNWFGLAFSGVVSFLLTPFLIHSLGNFYYGMWVLAASLLDYYGLLDIGIRISLFRFVARAKGANERAVLDSTIATALAITVVTGSLLVLLTPELAVFLPRFFSLAPAEVVVFRWLLVLVGLSLALTFPARVLGTYLSGLQRFDLYNLSGVAATFLRACLLVIVLFEGQGAIGVAAVTLAVAVFSIFFNWVLLRRADPAISIEWRGVSWSRACELIHYGIYAFLNVSGEYLRSYTDSIVIARMLGVSLVAPFSIATRLMEYFKSVFSGIGAPMMGVMSEIDGKMQEEVQKHYLLFSTRYTALASFFCAGILILDGRAFIRLWVGEKYLSVYPLVVILTIAYAVGLGQYPSQLVLFARAQHRPLAVITLLEGVANLLLSIYWGRQYGLWGVALGTAVPMLAAKIFFQPWYALSALRISVWEYISSAIARPAIALALFGGLAWLTTGSPSREGFASLLSIVAWQTVLFTSLAFLLGLNEGDRRFLWRRSKQLQTVFFTAQPEEG